METTRFPIQQKAKEVGATGPQILYSSLSRPMPHGRVPHFRLMRKRQLTPLCLSSNFFQLLLLPSRGLYFPFCRLMTTTFLCDVTSTPGGENKARFLIDICERAKTGDEASHFGCTYAFGEIPRCSGRVDKGTTGQVSILVCLTLQGHLLPASVRTQSDRVHELSSRSRDILKQSFEEIQPFSLFLGHPTVTFTESQRYNVLRAPTDETVSFFYATIDHMIIKPVLATTRADHFRAKIHTNDRTQT